MHASCRAHKAAALYCMVSILQPLSLPDSLYGCIESDVRSDRVISPYCPQQQQASECYMLGRVTSLHSISCHVPETMPLHPTCCIPLCGQLLLSMCGKEIEDIIHRLPA